MSYRGFEYQEYLLLAIKGSPFQKVESYQQQSGNNQNGQYDRKYEGALHLPGAPAPAVIRDPGARLQGEKGLSGHR